MIAIVEQARRYLNRKAVISNDQTYSYQDLLDASHRVASALLAEKTDLVEARIAFMVPSSFDYVKVQWGKPMDRWKNRS